MCHSNTVYCGSRRTNTIGTRRGEGRDSNDLVIWFKVIKHGCGRVGPGEVRRRYTEGHNKDVQRHMSTCLIEDDA